jgi:hypothetical protein
MVTRTQCTTAYIRRTFQNNVRLDIVLDVSIYIPEHSRRDGIGSDAGSSWWSELDATAGEAMGGVLALVVPTTA